MTMISMNTASHLLTKPGSATAKELLTALRTVRDSRDEEEVLRNALGVVRQKGVKKVIEERLTDLASASEETPTEDTPKVRKVSTKSQRYSEMIRALLPLSPVSVAVFEVVADAHGGILGGATRNMSTYSWNLGDDGRQPADKKPLVKAALREGIWGFIDGSGKERTLVLTEVGPEEASTLAELLRVYRRTYDEGAKRRKEEKRLRKEEEANAAAEVEAVVNQEMSDLLSEDSSEVLDAEATWESDAQDLLRQNKSLELAALVDTATDGDLDALRVWALRSKGSADLFLSGLSKARLIAFAEAHGAKPLAKSRSKDEHVARAELALQ